MHAFESARRSKRELEREWLRANGPSSIMELHRRRCDLIAVTIKRLVEFECPEQRRNGDEEGIHSDMSPNTDSSTVSKG